MMKKAWKMKRDEEGEMGVGTLLIFIAMILVAAVAASVLVSTAYKLQQQAEETGDQALADVATGFRAVATFGITDANGNITSIVIKVALMAGSPTINLENVLIETVKTVTAVGAGAGDEATLAFGDVNWTNLRDMPPTTAASNYTTSGDLWQVNITVTMAPQEQYQITIIPKHGVPTLLTVTAPATLPISGVVNLW